MANEHPAPRNPNTREPRTIPFDHPQVTATTTWKMWKVPAGRKFRVTRASYINVTGLAADNTNAFAGTLQNGSTVVASLFNTDGNDVPAGASLAADTFVEGTLSATDASLVLAAGDILSLVVTEDGAATLPAGRLVVEGYLI